MVAERFRKEHSDVMKGIKTLIEGVGKSSDTLFIPTQYQHQQNKQMYPEYLLTRDGFTLLAMGFTGKEAELNFQPRDELNFELIEVFKLR